VIFVLLVVQAFLFGLRATLLRIGFVAVVIVVYALAGSFGLGLGQHDLAEWPLMFVIAILVALMADWRAATVRHFETLFRRASDRLLAVQEDERRRFARELHDGVGQTLTALTLRLDAAADGATDSAVAAERVASARRLAQDALLETHDLATRLRPARIEQLGLARALRDLAERSGCQVEMKIGSEASRPDLLSAHAGVEVYRIVQEALANVARHSGVGVATVSLAVRDDVLRVVVEDAGRGFDPASVRDGGLGLAGIRERTALLGGRVTIESAPGAGTRLALLVPVDGATEP
jgi:signal transduction histidine kinase